MKGSELYHYTDLQTKPTAKGVPGSITPMKLELAVAFLLISQDPEYEPTGFTDPAPQSLPTHTLSHGICLQKGPAPQNGKHTPLQEAACGV